MMDSHKAIETFQPLTNDILARIKGAIADFSPNQPLPVGCELDFVYRKLKNLDLIDQSIIESIRANVVRSKAVVEVFLSKPEYCLSGKVPAYVIQWHDEQNHALGKLQAQLGTSRHSLRATANRISRPYIRDLTILDLPDEILAEIFEHATAGPLGTSTTTKKAWVAPRNVKNVRLVCRRFCGASSSLLLSLVSVDFTSALSVARLEEVSRHPTISKGVRTIRVVLHYHDPVVAKNIKIFAAYTGKKLKQIANRLHDSIMERSRTESAASTTDVISTYLPMIAAVERMRSMAHNILVRAPHRHGDLGFVDRRILDAAFQDYQIQTTQQQQRHEDGSFVHAIASSVKRMPTVSRIEISDRSIIDLAWGTPGQYEDSKFWNDGVDFSSIIFPLTWEDARHRCNGKALTQPPVDLLTKLPVALLNAGVYIEHLDIRVAAPGSWSTDHEDSQDLIQLGLALQKLKSLHFSPSGGRILLNHADFMPFGRFVSAILSSQRMEKLFLDLSTLRSMRGPPLPMLERILSMPVCRGLTHLKIWGASFHLADLEELLEARRTPFQTLGFRKTQLLSGTWAEVLDALKGRCPLGTDLRTALMPQWYNLSEVKRSELMDKVEQYLQGQMENNPLR